MKKTLFLIGIIILLKGCKSEGQKNQNYISTNYENGNPEYINRVVNGKIEGASISFYENGNLSSFVIINNDSIINGPSMIFFRNGKINVYDNYLNGLKEGISVFYGGNGKLKSKEYYRNGIKDGKQYYFKDNGDTLRVENYENGKIKY